MADRDNRHYKFLVASWGVAKSKFLVRCKGIKKEISLIIVESIHLSVHVTVFLICQSTIGAYFWSRYS
jgi:hypothetical protein